MKKLTEMMNKVRNSKTYGYCRRMATAANVAVMMSLTAIVVAGVAFATAPAAAPAATPATESTAAPAAAPAAKPAKSWWSWLPKSCCCSSTTNTTATATNTWNKVAHKVRK